MPRHRVKLTSGYWMAQTEVTQGEFSKVDGANPSRVTRLTLSAGGLGGVGSGDGLLPETHKDRA